MIYLAKITMRRRILGIDGPSSTLALEVNSYETSGDSGFAASEDVISILDFKSQVRPSALERVDVDAEAVRDPITTPALNGAIPLAIFDHATKQPFYNASVAEGFFNMFSVFREVGALPKIIQHVVDSMKEQFPTDPSTWTCFVKQSVVGTNPLNAEFPTALLESLGRLKISLDEVENKAMFSKKMESWMESILGLKDLDPGIEKVLQFQIRKLQ